MHGSRRQSFADALRGPCLLRLRVLDAVPVELQLGRIRREEDSRLDPPPPNAAVKDVSNLDLPRIRVPLHAADVTDAAGKDDACLQCLLPRVAELHVRERAAAERAPAPELIPAADNKGRVRVRAPFPRPDLAR